VELGLGEYAQARTQLEEGLALARETDDPRTLALITSNLGDVARCQGDYARAEVVYGESLALYQALGNKADIPAILHNLGYVALGQGKVDDAYALHLESLLEQRDRGNPSGVAEGLAGLAAIACAQGQFERAARLFGAAEALAERNQRMIWPAERFERDRHIAWVRTHLDAVALNAAWATGRTMTEEQAIQYALTAENAGPLVDAAQPSSDPAHRLTLRQAEKQFYGGLTGRECEVAALIAQGKSNRALGEQLVITERTAERHVANILSKLGFHSRTQIAAWAVEKGLASLE
jgi:DNA-binding CsgD family transcriptional regulator